MINDKEERGVKLEDITIRCGVKPGDAGYITYMHGWIYSQERGYLPAFEGYVAQSFCDFLLNYNPKLDRLWVAQQGDEIVGSIAALARGERAQLRWFILHPRCRGIGLGRRLFDGALSYCREAGFKSAYLITTSDLQTAISMYEKAGFVKTSETVVNEWKEGLAELEYTLEL